MRHCKLGVELGIRAKLEAITEGAKICDDNMLDYFLVPETNPKILGVDALSTIESLVDKIENTTMGTGIVNVFSRRKETMARICRSINNKSGGRFVLGLGTSAPAIIEGMYKMRFQKPLSRLAAYTDYLKTHQVSPVFWAVVGDKITELAAKKADGVMFFLRPEGEIRRSMRILKSSLAEKGRDYKKLETISIRPTFIEGKKNGYRMAKLTIANYVGANPFYSGPIERAGFEKEVKIIRNSFVEEGLAGAARHVSKKMVDELTIIGSPKECAEKILVHAEKTKVKAVIAGFDMSKEGYDASFFSKLYRLSGGL